MASEIVLPSRKIAKSLLPQRLFSCFRFHSLFQRLVGLLFIVLPPSTFSKLAHVEFYSPYLAKKISSLSFTDNLNTSEMLKISDALKSTVPLSLLYSVSLDTPVFSAIETTVIPESLILLLSRSNFTKLSSPPLLNFIHVHTITSL